MISFDKLGEYGRLGNQLFQYAFLRTKAEDLGVKFYCPRWIGDEVFDLNDSATRTAKSENFLIILKEPLNRRRCNPKDFIVFDDVNIIGQFESEKFFDAEKVKKWYVFKEEKISSIKEKYINIDFSSSAGLHLRLGDKLLDSRYNKIFFVPRLSYYVKALNLLNCKDVLIFSDNIEMAKKYFLKSGLNCTYMEGNKDWEDLYLMSLCRNFICGSSTLSWWGSWLNKNSGKIIFFPKEGLFRPCGYYDNNHLIPDNWVKIRSLRIIADSYLVKGFPLYDIDYAKYIGKAGEFLKKYFPDLYSKIITHFPKKENRS